MEANVCDVNNLDSDVLLPPRKRLLACLKKQNGDVNGNGNSYSNSQATCSLLNNLDARIRYLLRPHLSNDNPSQEEIVAASKSAAEAAIKAAMAARASAEEKAVIAAKAMAAAKKALELVETNDDDQEDISSSAEQQLKKNKMKKHVDVQMLYANKKPRLENGKTNDEELARKLHQAINSSPRISKGGLPSDVKIHKNKKLKSSNISEHGNRISNEGIVREWISPNSNGASKAHDKEVENTIKSKTENMDAERVLQSKAKVGEEDIATLGRKRGKMKQKKLPLSICHDKDLSIPKEDGTTSRSSFSVGQSTNNVVERSSSWKCQAFKAPTCVKQNKVMQS